MSVMSGAQSAANPKLPLGQTITEAYASYSAHFSDVLRISWLWMLVAAAFAGTSSSLQMSWMADVLANSGAGKPMQIPARPIGMVVLGNVAGLVFLLAGVSIAVAWHRRLLLDEAPGFSGDNIITASLWRYVGVSLLICLIVGVPALLITAPVFFWLGPAKTGGGIAVAVLVVFLVYIAAIVAAIRLCLLLPARAIGDFTLTFNEAWARTHGNTWRIFWGIVACTLPPMLLAQIALATLVGFPNPLALAKGQNVGWMVAASAIVTSYYLLTLPIWIGFLSHAYRHFFGQIYTNPRYS
jgi:hypothetical protein